ncbi:MAG: M50 family metallopeptidase [Pseudomonadota bacterium]
MSRKASFWLLTLLAVVISYVPFINQPFNWVETYFHEMSHGLASILTGGKFNSIRIYWNGSGLAYSSGGIRFWIAFSGYLGAQLMAVLFYAAGTVNSSTFRSVFTFLTCLSVILAIILLSGSIQTTIILCILLGLFTLPLLKFQKETLKLFIQFIGLYVLQRAIFSPIWQLGAPHSDATALASITMIPAFFWIGVWIASGAICFYWLMKLNR